MASFSLVMSFVVVLTSLAEDTHAIRNYKTDLCQDASFWDVISYRAEDRCCDETKVKPNCVYKTQELCKDVTEMKCEATAWVECKPLDSGKKSSFCKAVQETEERGFVYEVSHLVFQRKCIGIYHKNSLYLIMEEIISVAFQHFYFIYKTV